MKVVVVGGGITGLVAARTLLNAGVDVVLIEAGDRLGGKIRSDRVGGALIEAGPDWFVTRQPAALRLCESLGLAADLVPPAVTGVRIWARGELRTLPAGLVRGVPASVRALLTCRQLSPRGRLRALADLVLPGPLSGPDASVGSLVRRRFGPQLLERLVDPMLVASRSGTADEISLAAAAPEIDAAARTHRSVIRGLARAQTNSERVIARYPGENAHKVREGPEFVGLRGGMGRLVDALKAALGGAEVHLGTAAARVRAATNGYSVTLDGGRELEAAGVVLAVPAFAAAALLSDLSPEAAVALAAIRYEPATVIGLVYPPGAADAPLDASGWLVPSSEGRLLRACAWFSSKWPHIAPEDGGVVLRCFVGAEAGHHGDAELTRAVLNELREAAGIRAEPRATHVVRWDRALPVYEVGHLERVAAAELALGRWPGLALAGAGYRGSGLPDCIADGEAAAERLLAACRLPHANDEKGRM